MAFVCLCAFKLKQIRWAWAPAVLPRLHGAPHQTLFLFTFMTTPCPALFEGHFYPFSIRGSLAFHLFTFFFFFFFSLFFFFPFLAPSLFTLPDLTDVLIPQKSSKEIPQSENCSESETHWKCEQRSTNWNKNQPFNKLEPPEFVSACLLWKRSLPYQEVLSTFISLLCRLTATQQHQDGCKSDRRICPSACRGEKVCQLLE